MAAMPSARKAMCILSAKKKLKRNTNDNQSSAAT